MDSYKSLDKVYIPEIVDDAYDNVYTDNNISEYSVDDFRNLCLALEASYNAHAIKYQKINEIINRINNYSYAFSDVQFSTVVREFCVIDIITELIKFDDQDEESDDHQYLQSNLLLLVNFTSKSVPLCKWCIRKGTINVIINSIWHYDEISMSFILTIFNNLLTIGFNIGQVILIPKIANISIKIIHSSSTNSTIAAKILSSISLIKLPQEQKTKDIFQKVINNFYYIFDKRITEAYTNALKGLIGIILNDSCFITEKIMDICIYILIHSNNINQHFYSLKLIKLLFCLTNDSKLIFIFSQQLFGNQKQFQEIFNLINSNYDFIQLSIINIFQEISFKVPNFINLLIENKISAKIHELFSSSNFILKQSISYLICIMIQKGTIIHLEYICQNGLLSYLFEVFDSSPTNEIALEIIHTLIQCQTKYKYTKKYINYYDLQYFYNFIQENPQFEISMESIKEFFDEAT